MNMRIAQVIGERSTLTGVEAYMPSNYRAFEANGNIYIVGADFAGWTMDEYVLPRLGSGLHFAREITEDEWLFGLDS